MDTNQTTPAVAIVAVVIVVIGGLYWWYVADQNVSVMTGDTTYYDDSTALPSGTSTDDAALDSDLSAIDSTMNGFEDDTSQIDQGVAAQGSGSDF